MKVLMLNPAYSGGGAERSARELLHGLRAKGHHVEMWVANPSASLPEGVSGLRTRWERMLRLTEKVGMGGDWRFIGSRRQLDKLNAGSFDLIHLHNPHGNWLSFAALQRVARRIPMVWTLHDEYAATRWGAYDLSRVLSVPEIERRFGTAFPLYPQAKSSKQILKRQGSLHPRPASIISPSRYVLSLAEKSGFFSDVCHFQLPYGVKFLTGAPVDTAQSEAREHFGIPVDRAVVLLVANQLTSPFKGMPWALDALRMMKNPKLHLLMVGTSTPDFLREISFPATQTGYLSDERAMAFAYRAADLTLIPSIAENFPYVALESLACQVPIVTFDIGGLPEMTGGDQRGITVPPLDTAAMARAMDHLLSDADYRKKLGEAGRSWVRENCDFDRWIDQHEQIYEQSMSGFAKSAGVSSKPVSRVNE